MTHPVVGAPVPEMTLPIPTVVEDNDPLRAPGGGLRHGVGDAQGSARSARERRGGQVTAALTDAPGRAIPDVLRDWRAAEERLLHEPGDRARSLIAGVNASRDQDRWLGEPRTFEAMTRPRSR